MKITITKDDYQKFLANKQGITNSRLRAEGQDFMDAILSVDFFNTEEGKIIMDTLWDPSRRTTMPRASYAE